MIICASYLLLITCLLIYNMLKFRRGAPGPVNSALRGVQVKLMVLMFLLGLKAQIIWYYLHMCPWKVENTKKVSLANQGMDFIEVIEQTFFTYTMLTFSFGHGIIMVEMTLEEMQYAFGVPAVRFILTQIFRTILFFSYMPSFTTFVLLIYDILTVFVIGFFVYETFKRIAGCLARLQNEPMHRHIRD